MTFNTNLIKKIDYYSFFQNTKKIRVIDGKLLPIIDHNLLNNYTLILLFPSLGDFDSLEYAWWLNREIDLLKKNNIILKAMGIGDVNSGKKFCQYTGFNPEFLFIDSSANVHQELNLYRGLTLQFPLFSNAQNAWLNLILMCAGIGSKSTLKEVFRGYLGDKKAPQLFTENQEINLKPLLNIKGSFFNVVGKNYQRPFELATLRLQNMIEVLHHWKTYVPNSEYLTQRGGTFLFNQEGKLIYKYEDKGILGFAENMSYPLSFLDKAITINENR